MYPPSPYCASSSSASSSSACPFSLMERRRLLPADAFFSFAAIHDGAFTTGMTVASALRRAAMASLNQSRAP